MSAGRYRAWCFTLFVEDDTGDYKDLLEGSTGVRFGIWQLEMCPTSQRYHLQGYIEFTSAVRLSTLKLLIGNSVHGESRKASRQLAIEYCRKEESRVRGPWTYGDEDCVRPGKRTDLDNVAETIQGGGHIDDVVGEYPVQYIRFRRGIEALYNHGLKKRAQEWRQVQVLVYWGEAGSGKTRKAIEENSSRFILDQGDRVWFDGYSGEDCLIIDDFYGWIKFGQFLRILDGHPLRLEIKGGFTWALWKRVIITSNKPWAEWYGSVTDSRQVAALRRRISEEIHFPNAE